MTRESCCIMALRTAERGWILVMGHQQQQAILQAMPACRKIPLSRSIYSWDTGKQSQGESTVQPLLHRYLGQGAWKVQEIPRCTDRNMWGHFRYSQTSCLASPCHWSSLMGPVSRLLALGKCLGHPKVSSRLQKLILAFWVSPQPKIRFAQGCSQSLHIPASAAGSREKACFNSALLAWGQATP